MSSPEPSRLARPAWTKFSLMSTVAHILSDCPAQVPVARSSAAGLVAHFPSTVLG